MSYQHTMLLLLSIKFTFVLGIPFLFLLLLLSLSIIPDINSAISLVMHTCALAFLTSKTSYEN